MTEPHDINMDARERARAALHGDLDHEFLEHMEDLKEQAYAAFLAGKTELAFKAPPFFWVALVQELKDRRPRNYAVADNEPNDIANEMRAAAAWLRSQAPSGGR